MTSKFYKGHADGQDGEEGYYYCEVENELIIKQIFVFGSDMYWATESAENNENYIFTDQPEFPVTDIPMLEMEYGVVEIIRDDFYRIWEKAQKLTYI